jgi:ATP-dependent DNA ligase
LSGSCRPRENADHRSSAVTPPAARDRVVPSRAPCVEEHIEGDGPTVFRHACKLGLEGIVSKRKDSAYRSGRSPDWLKMKNANAAAAKREEEEDWGR